MGETEISWTHRPGTVGKTWNPIQGCRRVSTGCENCYAERLAARFAETGWSQGLINLKTKKWNGVARLATHKLAEPLTWRKPATVFTNSMSDLFYDGFSNEQIAAVFGVMAAAPQHTFQVLTKRAKRMREWFEWAAGEFTMQQRDIAAAPHTFRAMLDAAYEELGKPVKPALDAAWNAHENDAWPLPNVWLGVSVENQEAADERIPELLRTPAAVRFLSCEPLIGAVDLRHVQHNGEFEVDALTGDHGVNRPLAGRGPGIDWVIAGCESGPRSRPCDVAWLRALRDQCAAAGVPYFLKQAKYTPNEWVPGMSATLVVGNDKYHNAAIATIGRLLETK